MVRTKWTEDYFRKGLKAEREHRNLTQPELAELFKANGLNLHWSTIAKIENGDRSVRIDEAACIADVFKVSLDTMLGRATTADRDEVYTVQALTHAVRHTVSLAESLESDLRDRIADVEAFNLGGWIKDMVTGCQGAAEALGAVQDALRGAMNPPGLHGLRDMAREELRKELEAGVPSAEAQS